MKKLTVLIGLVGLFLQGCAQPTTYTPDERPSIEWGKRYIGGLYSEELEQPLMVSYIVECVEGTASREGMDFYTDDYIHTSDDKDYYKNEWDKGHMAPAADFKCDEEAMYETFTYLNCALQHEKLNRTTWKYLEEYERDLTEFGDVSVYIEIDFDQDPPRVSAGAAIPRGFYKQLTVGDQTICFWFPNVEPTSSDFRDYECECR